MHLVKLIILGACMECYCLNAEDLLDETFATGLSLMDTPTTSRSQVDTIQLVGHRPTPHQSAHSNFLEQLSLFAAIDGSKQPQDFGVNADLGVRLRAAFSAPLIESYGIGYQIGTAVTTTDNAVRVFELMGEDTNRFQSFTTFGLFQRHGRWGFGGVFDYLYQDGFDTTSLGQFRARASYDITCQTQVGVTGRFRAFDDTAEYLGNPVTLRSINQGSVFVRHFFETGVQSTWWFGLVDEHGESNAAFGAAPSRENDAVIGADFVAPLNDSFALYGETNLILPADSGTVDAFFGIAWYPFTNAKVAHRRQYSPFLSVAAPTSFAVDLVP
ncbi:DUF6666 family protein [Neorhodopirellula pilleata]|uniref:Inverse autotransporter beta-domain domain-containing protein n=1 Tax=Neorhodopirellula pilleata TaxID=2714738 RepID=A0A5C6AQS1_9BACT|nr:DUF6666 family protein [Neorhodopirellula pilleata]TWU01908.1 hypothetical protein Pla100_16440 [Neorhodopirellula pilleata]